MDARTYGQGVYLGQQHRSHDKEKDEYAMFHPKKLLHGNH